VTLFGFGEKINFFLSRLININAPSWISKCRILNFIYASASQHENSYTATDRKKNDSNYLIAWCYLHFLIQDFHFARSAFAYFSNFIASNVRLIIICPLSCKKFEASNGHSYMLSNYKRQNQQWYNFFITNHINDHIPSSDVLAELSITPSNPPVMLSKLLKSLASNTWLSSPAISKSLLGK